MHSFSTLVFTVIAVVLVGIPATAVAVACRDDLRPAANRLRRALAFDPRHPALAYPSAR
jgi:hypothetical protein